MRSGYCTSYGGGVEENGSCRAACEKQAAGVPSSTGEPPQRLRAYKWRRKVLCDSADWRSASFVL